MVSIILPPKSPGGNRGSYALSADCDERQPNRAQPKHPLCTWILENKIPKSMHKSPKLEEYNEEGDPDDHVQLFKDQLKYYCVDDTSKCKLLVLTLVRPA